MGLVSDIKGAAGALPGAALDVAQDAGRWAWDNKGEIGLWLGTAALVAAIPMTGGASGAAAGGLMASRAAMLGVKVAGTGKAGQAAVSLARAGAGALNHGGTAVRSARMAVGRLPLGDGRQLAQTLERHDVLGKLGKVGMPLAFANAADQTVKGVRGDGDVRGLLLSYLGMVPIAGNVVKSIASRRAAAHGAAALDEVAQVEQRISGAADAVAETSRSVPAARSAMEQAGSARQAAGAARERAAEVASDGAARAADPGEVVTRLQEASEQVAGAAQAASKVEDAVPAAAAKPLAAAREELEEASRAAAAAMPRVERAAAASGRLQHQAAVAERTAEVTGRAGAPLALGNNLYGIVTTPANQAQGTGPSAAGTTSAAMGTLRVLLQRNARSAPAAD